MEYVARKSNLVVPEGFVELDREEMTYVDGGGYLPTMLASTGLDLAFMALGIGFLFAPVKWLGKFFGRKLAERLLWSKMGMISQVVADVVCTALPISVNLSIGSLGSAILGNIWNFTSLGGIIAYVLDPMFDGCRDGWI